MHSRVSCHWSCALVTPQGPRKRRHRISRGQCAAQGVVAAGLQGCQGSAASASSSTPVPLSPPDTMWPLPALATTEPASEYRAELLSARSL
ncbi:hypothetical protein AAY473_000071, partial [Plecturocebus cupreus]